MTHRKEVTVLVPSELLYAVDLDVDNTFIAVRKHGLIVLLPIATYTENQCNADNTDYRRGYLMGMGDGYHKGYSDAMAYEELHNAYTEDDADVPRCTEFCRACPYCDNLFDTCKFYS